MLTVWREPLPKRPYCMGVDTAEGLIHGDYSCAQMLDVRSGEQVAVWQSGANDYYRAPSGKIVTQWPFGFAAYKEQVSKDGLTSFETGSVQRG